MATVPNPRTWTVGELLTAAKLNTDLRDGLNFLLSPPLAVLRISANTLIANNTLVSVSWTTEAIDRDGGHDNVTNPIRYTAQTAGWYDIAGSVLFYTASGGIRSMSLLEPSGVPIAGNTAPGNGVIVMPVSASKVFFLNVGDYFTMQLYQDSGASLNIWGSGPNTPTQMSAKWVSKA